MILTNFTEFRPRIPCVPAVALALVGTAALLLAQESDGRRPSIVVILADDLGSGDPGSYNKASKIPTPNIDRLAAEGMRFTNAHSPSAVCTPTRYGLLTGRYAWRTRLKNGVLRGFSPCLVDVGRLTVASLLKKHGYSTACVGKWHLGLGNARKTDYSAPLRPGPNDLGFDYFYGIPASLDMEPYLYVENSRSVEEPTRTVGASRHRRQNGGGFWRAGPVAPGFRHIDVLPTITRKAVGFIDRHAKESPGKPFFLYFPLTAPHTPWLPTKEFRGKSGAGYYGDFTAQVDACVGEVLRALDRGKLSASTLVMFTSDNGSHWPPGDIEKWGHAANLHLRGQKADIWEGGHRVPFLARWPGKIAPGSTSDQILCLTDIVATVAELLGAPLPDDAGEDSYSFLPALLGQKSRRELRDAVVHHSSRGVFAIRQGAWKLILGRGSGGFSRPHTIQPEPGEPPGQLYHLADDLAETSNLYLQRPEVVAQLRSLLETYRRQGRSRPLGK